MEHLLQTRRRGRTKALGEYYERVLTEPDRGAYGRKPKSIRLGPAVKPVPLYLGTRDLEPDFPDCKSDCWNVCYCTNG